MDHLMAEKYNENNKEIIKWGKSHQKKRFKKKLLKKKYKWLSNLGLGPFKADPTKITTIATNVLTEVSLSLFF